MRFFSQGTHERVRNSSGKRAFLVKPLKFCCNVFSSNFACKSFFHPNIFVITLKCLSIGTPKTIYFPFVSNGKLIVFRCPSTYKHIRTRVTQSKHHLPYTESQYETVTAYVPLYLQLIYSMYSIDIYILMLISRVNDYCCLIIIAKKR